MINDFKEVTAVVWVQKYGNQVMITDAWQVGGQHKGYQDNKDSIGLFVNYELVFETKVKQEAYKYMENLISKVPKELSKEFEEFKHYLLNAITDSRSNHEHIRDR